MYVKGADITAKQLGKIPHVVTYRMSGGPVMDTPADISFFMNKRDVILDEVQKNNWISQKQYEFFKVEHPSTPVFYLLPKVVCLFIVFFF